MSTAAAAAPESASTIALERAFTTYNGMSVMKFGGSSFSTRSRIMDVCAFIRQRLRENSLGHRIVCVVSAPAGLTEQYRETLLDLHPGASDRLIDAGLPLADSVGAVLVAGALQSLGVGATVALGAQIGLRTDRNYTRAQLQDSVTAPVVALFAEHQVVVVPGGQAAAADTFETTWMGKNSSDLSAIALAAAFGRDSVEICSDVPGVYSCDPSLVPDAYPLARLSRRQAVAMSLAGAKVLHHRGVQFAEDQGIRIVCKGNTGEFAVGTILGGDDPMVAAVIPDARSQVFTGADAQLGAAAAAFALAGVPCIAVEPSIGQVVKHLVVTCGFFDAPQFLVRQGIDLVLLPLRLVSAITASGEMVRELVAPDQLAARARDLHRQHCLGSRPAAGHAVAASTPAPAAPEALLYERLSVLPQLTQPTPLTHAPHGGETRHV